MKKKMALVVCIVFLMVTAISACSGASESTQTSEPTAAIFPEEEMVWTTKTDIPFAFLAPEATATPKQNCPAPVYFREEIDVLTGNKVIIVSGAFYQYITSDPKPQGQNFIKNGNDATIYIVFDDEDYNNGINKGSIFVHKTIFSWSPVCASYDWTWTR